MAERFDPGGDPARAEARAPALPAPTPRTTAEKVALFGALFRGRADVHARRWENARTRKAGYSPHCANEWRRGLCGKPRVRCGACPARALVPMTEQVLLDHLRGAVVAGVYPLLEGNRCWFLAIDFDEGSWQEDVAAFVETSRAAGLPVAVERSRSGRGAHAWFFFAGPVAAIDARRMASRLLAESMSRRPERALSSYDRVFPCQDALPRGGLGNLIALPLQREARLAGNTVFVDDAFVPFADQWAHLAGLLRIAPETVALVAGEAQRCGPVLRVREAEVSAYA